jgi:hypothetical protein
MKKVFFLVFTVSFFSFLIYGCGTIFHGTSDYVSVKSSPTSASVTVKNDKGIEVNHGKTPSTFKLKKNSDYSILIKLDGYKEQTAFVSTSWNALYGIMSIVCSGLVGVIVDIITGGWNDLEPLSINVTLETAMNENYEEMLCVLFTAKDEEGKLHQLRVPMIRNY